MNALDIISQFKSAMLDAGIVPPEHIIADGALHRFKIDDKLNGSYALHLDTPPAGWFKDWKQGIKENWRLNSNHRLSDLERQAIAERARIYGQRKREEERARHRAAASKANAIWSQSKPAESNHSYLRRKKVNPHGIRAGRGNLIIPLFDKSRQIVNLQFIDAAGGKRFLSGGKKKGCFFQMGNVIDPTERICVVEGYATGASVYEHTGCPTFVAFDSGNLEPVAIVLRKLYPDVEIIVYGDNDSSGVGQKAARAAAIACGGLYTIPEEPDSDWNDVFGGGNE
ncbi:toprim domain-containing protein [Methylobacter sp. sgz302048]|uniref:toprim domain-containing protein n=1 Tax=Methylobacter sp. sgz302048 TaxID=3455945 RepID=UPI003F9F52FD